MISFWHRSWPPPEEEEWHPNTTVMAFAGVDDWRIGVQLERHPTEWHLTLQVPCLMVVVSRFR